MVERKLKSSKYKSYDVYKDDEYIGYTTRGPRMYKDCLEPFGINWEDVISQKLCPDDAFVNEQTKTIYIVEKKFQNVSGSVDEKLQTCDFKRRQYEKLFNPIGYEVKYIYVLNDWYKQPRYKDVLDYILDVQCYYFFNVLPLDFLNL